MGVTIWKVCSHWAPNELLIWQDPDMADTELASDKWSGDKERKSLRHFTLSKKPVANLNIHLLIKSQNRNVRVFLQLWQNWFLSSFYGLLLSVVWAVISLAEVLVINMFDWNAKGWFVTQVGSARLSYNLRWHPLLWSFRHKYPKWDGYTLPPWATAGSTLRFSVEIPKSRCQGKIIIFEMISSSGLLVAF